MKHLFISILHLSLAGALYSQAPVGSYLVDQKNEGGPNSKVVMPPTPNIVWTHNENGQLVPKPIDDFEAVAPGTGGYFPYDSTTTFTRGLLDDADAATARTTLGAQSVHANLTAIAGGTWTGANSITTLGTITTGVWQGTAIADARIASAATWNAKAGTGANTFSGTQTYSIGQLRSTVPMSNTAKGFDFYWQSGNPTWPTGGARLATWRHDVNGVSLDIMALEVVDTTSYKLLGLNGLAFSPSALRVASSGGNMEFIDGTLRFVQAGNPFVDISKFATEFHALYIDPSNAGLVIGTRTQPQRVVISNTWSSNTSHEGFAIDWQAESNVARVGPVAGPLGGTVRTAKYYFNASVWDGAGSGSPEGVAGREAGIGSTYRDTATGNVYRKTSGTGNTGWVTP